MKKDDPLPSPRHLAVKIIEKTLSGVKVQEAFNHYAEKFPLSIQDRQFCADLVYGYLRTSKKLDFILGRFLKKPKKLPQSVLLLLALAVYSLLFQEKIPSYAAINESVKEIKKNYGQVLANVANAVLRNIHNAESSLCEADWYRKEAGDELKGDAIFYSMPEPVLKLWINAYGREKALKLLKRSASRPWQGLRVNARHEKAGELKNLLAGIDEVVRIGDYGFAFPPGKYREELCGKSIADLVQEGALSLQAPASMLIMEELGLAELKGPVWDCCAGSGIKSAALLEKGLDLALASDTSLPRLENIKPFCERLGLDAPKIVQASATQPPLQGWPGHIIADVPCTGLGMLSRRPDIRLNIDKEAFWKNHASLQMDMMARLVELLEEDKKLVYITCTLNPHENELLVQDLLREYPELKLEKEWQSPHEHSWLEGMYGAVFTKSAS